MEEYLMHHGIKGQKWGVRRFQNEDGSLTGAGKKRYGFDSALRKVGTGVVKIARKPAQKIAKSDRYKKANSGFKKEFKEKHTSEEEKKMAISRAKTAGKSAAKSVLMGVGAYGVARLSTVASAALLANGKYAAAGAISGAGSAAVMGLEVGSAYQSIKAIGNAGAAGAHYYKSKKH